jgi:polar amino acid transport system substrate-binding protein
MKHASSRRLLLFFVASTFVTLALSPSRGDDRKDEKKGAIPPVLRWGADFSGGEPYVIERKGEQPEGFEGELAAYLAKKLGVKNQSEAGAWENLPQFLKANRIDLVLNGYEWSAEREQEMSSTIPYYAYRLRLIVLKGGKINDWSDLKPGMRVGVLKDSAAERYVSDRERFPGLDVRGFSEEGTTGVMKLVEQGALDATVQDDPVVSWYLNKKNEFPQLRVVGDPIAPSKQSYYVMFVRQEDKELLDRINEALTEGLRDGSIRKIYARYGLWDKGDEESQLLQAAKDWPPRDESQTVKSKGELLKTFAYDLGSAALVTVALTLLAMPLAMLIGLLVALGRLYGPWWLSVPLGVYVEVIRGTPVLFQLMILFFFLPTIGISLPAFWAGVLGLGINYGAYEAENYRAGLLAIPEGQMEASLALGMSRGTALRRVIVPQAFRLVIPPVTNDFISLFKDTSICSAIAVTELMSRYRTLTVNFPRMAVYALVLTGCLYLLMSYPLSLLARRLEAKQEEEEDAEA